MERKENLDARIEQAEAKEVATTPQHGLSLPPRQRLRLYPAPDLPVALPHPRFQPMPDAADKRCPRPGSRRPLGRNSTSASYPMSHGLNLLL